MTTSQAQGTRAAHTLLADGSLAGSWTLDPARSTVTLRSRSLWGALPVKGVFRDITGEGTVSDAGEVRGRISLATASFDSKIAKRDEHLRSDDFFSSEKFPAITFTADKAEPSGAGMTISGTLTVRDQSRPISFPASVAMTGEGEVSVDATVRIDRSEYGLTFNMRNMTSMQNKVTMRAVFTKN